MGGGNVVQAIRHWNWQNRCGGYTPETNLTLTCDLGYTDRDRIFVIMNMCAK